MNTRREFVKAAGALVGATALRRGWAQGRGQPRYRRLNVTDPAAARHLASYRKAIRAMLALPVTDPRNWYRYALIHALDCPHGNWWFLPWHRGYVGWFEQICRELSGDASFALPYWDWTQKPAVPDSMFGDVLTPTSSAFIATYADFYTTLKDIVAKADYWKRNQAGEEFDADSQYGQLLARAIRFPEDLWFDIDNDPRGKLFFQLSQARGLTREKPGFDEKTSKAVSLPTVLDALAPRDFVTFGSPKTAAHSALAGFGVLEGQPHNRVHNCVGGIFTDGDVTTDSGGFMQAFLSPVDPLFFLHHANMDRLWDIWTRKQLANGYETLPDGYRHPRPKPVAPLTDFELWSREVFAFFIDSKGAAVGGKAGDYAAAEKFDYDYQAGSGEEVVATALRAPRSALSARAFNATITRTAIASNGGSVARFSIPRAALDRSAGSMFAKITLALPASFHGVDFKVIVREAGASMESAARVEPRSPYYAGTLSMFGHHAMSCPITFTVPLSGPFSASSPAQKIDANPAYSVVVIPDSSISTHHAISHDDAGSVREAEVVSMVVEAH